MNRRRWLLSFCLVGAVGLIGCSKNNGGGGGSGDTLQSHLDYDEDASKLLVVLNRDLKGGEVLHADVKPVAMGQKLDCSSMSSELPEISQSRGGGQYVGPTVEQTMFDEPQTSPDTLLNPTEADYLSRLEQTYYVDVCVMNDSGVAHQARYDLRQALDSIGGGGKGDEFDDGHRIETNQAYATACISAMGDIPFWDRLAEDGGTGVMVQGVEEGTPLATAILDYANSASAQELDIILDIRAAEGIVDGRPFESLAQLDETSYVAARAFRKLTNYVEENNLVPDADSAFDWSTVDCTEIGTPIPTEVNGEPADDWVDQCDNPQVIYSHCEPDARTGANGPRVAHARNSKGTHWVLLCRKSHEAQGRYEDMAMIGHNPFTGQTCFFQNQLPPGETPRASNDGTRIPHPADDVSSEESPEVWNDFWMGIQGGIGPNGGINCQGCHSTDPFVHTPWIDGAKNPDGTPVVPRIGDDPDFVEGYNGPYTLIDAQDQGWNEPMHLVSDEASACTSCHRIGRDQWTMSSQYSASSEEEGGCVFCGQAPWLNRFDHKDAAWDGLLTESALLFENYFWMPPNADQVLNEELWPDSEFAKAMDFIRSCGENPDNPECEWAPLPAEPGDPTELPEVALTGPDLAKEALSILGAPYEADGTEHEGTRRCGECHATSKFGFRDWLERTEDAGRMGLDVRSDPNELTTEDALTLVNYMRKDGENTVFAAENIGILTAGAQFPYYKRLFQRAYGNDWGVPYGEFLSRVSMPKGSHPPLSAEEFAIVEKWFVQEGLAHLDEFLIEVPPPATCEDVAARYNVSSTPSPWLESHIDDMQFDGWGARNVEAGINMYGCGGGSGIDCFTGVEFPEKTEWASEEVPGGRIVQVREFDFSTSFWMRASADGRFIGNGGAGADNHRATITDLVTGRNIGVRGSYDPGFFPNNDGFIMQGGGAGLCGQSVLTNQALIEDGIDFSEPGCTTAEGINLYQHVAVNTEGGDYFVINSQFTSDSGGNSRDPRAPFSEGSTMKFSPMVFSGTDWTQKEQVIVDSPYEGDSVLSPSGKLVISRFAGPDGDALGYMLRQVVATPNVSSYNIDISNPVQFLCTPGAKANISFDERFSVTHHYENGTANIYLTDLLTGETVQVTNMPEGEKALFPHFRSDGWILFLTKGEKDVAWASDAALRMAQQ